MTVPALVAFVGAPAAGCHSAVATAHACAAAEAPGHTANQAAAGIVGALAVLPPYLAGRSCSGGCRQHSSFECLSSWDWHT